MRAVTNKTKTVKAKKRRCPICGKPALAPFTPFCSKRCAETDLARWLKGAYAIPGRELSQEEIAANMKGEETAEPQGSPTRAKN
jgi:endogenous inhibitor of DNA gyrase (YacG/DUF329 family)